MHDGLRAADRTLRDLARAIDRDAGFDDHVVAACIDECQRRMPAQRAAESPFADAVSAEGRPLIDQLAAFLGRDLGFSPD